MSYHLNSVTKTRAADIETPIRLYLKLRDRFHQTLLLEHAERFHADGGMSYICCDPIAGIQVKDNIITQTFPDGTTKHIQLTNDLDVIQEVDDFIRQFSSNLKEERFTADGFFGYFGYDAVKYMEHIRISPDSQDDRQIPDIVFDIYRYVLVFDHFRNDITIVHFYLNDGDFAGTEAIEKLLNHQNIPSYPFHTTSEEQSNFTDAEFLDVIEQGKKHCYRGDVFQVVLSREFEVSFNGDEFNVYRALRSINPSPYLFFFDYGSYRLFGSSPEAQLKIKNGKATVHPIAGTYRRTGDSVEDAALIKALQADEKENAEHVMLIDLARNDLSKNYSNVTVPVFKSIQQFSHVLHIVSEVTGENPVKETGPVRIWSDTFPAGTLSGAPKHMAMQLINRYENRNRGFYGGSIGYIGFNGDFHQAIMIRSFLCRKSKLYYRAGAGIVAASVPSNELAEVNNKIAALRKAILLAKTTENEIAHP